MPHLRYLVDVLGECCKREFLSLLVKQGVERLTLDVTSGRRKDWKMGEGRGGRERWREGGWEGGESIKEGDIITNSYMYVI